MGLGHAEAEFLLAEHRFQPIRGEVLIAGRPAAGLTAGRAVQLLTATGTPLRSGHEGGGENRLTNGALLALFSDATVRTLSGPGVTSADVTADLGTPIRAELENRYDVIVTDGFLDGVFDAVLALRNMSRMVKPGGRLVMFERGNSFPDAYIKLTPDWFLDFFAYNRYADAKTYILHYPTLDGKEPFADHGLPIDAYHYDPLVGEFGNMGYQCTHPHTHGYTMNCVVAQKAVDSTHDLSPTQMHYRLNDEVRRPYLTYAIRFQEAVRPLFRRASGAPINGSPTLSQFGTLKPVASWAADE